FDLACASRVRSRTRRLTGTCALGLSLALLLGLTVPGTARAESPASPAAESMTDGERSWAIDAEIDNVVPVTLGAGVVVETPGRLRLGTSLGVMPGPYLDLVNAVSTGLDFYDQALADVITQVQDRSMIWTLRAGWRPQSDGDLHLDVGYSRVALGGTVSAADLMAISSIMVPAGEGLDDPFDIESTLHVARVEVGYVFWLEDTYVRLAVGGAFTMSANTTVDAGSDASVSRENIAVAGAEILDDTYTTYVHTGTVTLTLGYRLSGAR
ncbi:MAG: hypothetical protein AAGC55_16225, partial [Myxococcota bacterium]